ncbi:MAG: hypothetical protein AABY09_00655, partial [Nanoarchaeota archaeon]
IMSKPDIKGYSIYSYKDEAKWVFAKAPQEGVFRNGMKGLSPDSDYYKISCTEAQKKGSGTVEAAKPPYFYYYPFMQGNAVGMYQKSCRITKETADTLKNPKAKRDAQYDMDLKPKLSASFFFRAYGRSDKDSRLYNVHFWGAPSVVVDGVSLSKTSQPDIVVVKAEERQESRRGDPEPILQGEASGVLMGQQRMLSSKGSLYVTMTPDYDERYMLVDNRQVFVFGNDGKRLFTLNSGKVKLYNGNFFDNREDCGRHASSGRAMYTAACYFPKEYHLVLPEVEGDYDIVLFGYGREKFTISNWLFFKSGAAQSAEAYGNILNGKVVRILNYPQYP